MHPPEALYIHIPFCQRKCPYCDFYSVADRPDLAGPYVEALCAELADARTRLGPLALRTVYIGGGTPTLLRPEAMARLLDACRELFEVRPDAEVSCECNPGTVDAASLRALRSAGVNRLSIGVQSLDDGELRLLERVHSAAEARQAAIDAREAGLENLSLDLIYCLPGQTRAQWETNLAQAIELAPTHVSAYCLQVEKGTRLAARVEAGEVEPMPEDDQADLYLLTAAVLSDAGLAHYEVSNYAPPGAECAHNLTYWRNLSYVGVGASAWSFVDGERRQNVADVDAYLNAWESGRSAVAYRECCSGAAAANETLMMGLRLAEGISLSDFRARHGVDLRLDRADVIERLIGEGLASLNEDRLSLTTAGMAVAAEITSVLAFSEEE